VRNVLEKILVLLAQIKLWTLHIHVNKVVLLVTHVKQLVVLSSDGFSFFLHALLLLLDLVNNLVKGAVRNFVKHAVHVKVGVPIQKQGKEAKSNDVDDWQDNIPHVKACSEVRNPLDVQTVDVLPRFRHEVVVFVVLDKA